MQIVIYLYNKLLWNMIYRLIGVLMSCIILNAYVSLKTENNKTFSLLVKYCLNMFFKELQFDLFYYDRITRSKIEVVIIIIYKMKETLSSLNQQLYLRWKLVAQWKKCNIFKKQERKLYLIICIIFSTIL